MAQYACPKLKKTELAEQARQRSAQSYEQALASLEQAYEIRPNAPAIHKALLSYYLSSKEWDKAEKLVDKALGVTKKAKKTKKA